MDDGDGRSRIAPSRSLVDSLYRLPRSSATVVSKVCVWNCPRSREESLVHVMTDRSAIQMARRKRRALHETMIEFEAVLTLPRGAPSWVEDLARHLRALELALDDHIREVESDQGVIAQILQDFPRLASHAEDLYADHRRLTIEFVEVGDLIRSFDPDGDGDAVRALREAALELIQKLSRHRQRGSDLVYEAYCVDIGGPG